MKQVGWLIIFPLIVPLTPQEARRDDYTVKLKSTLVTVEAQVLTADGRIIGDLQKPDFLLYEDNVLQEAVQFERQQSPLSVALMMDTSGSMGSAEAGPLKIAGLIARKVIMNLHANDEVALFDVGDEPELIHPATGDKESALKKLDRCILSRSRGFPVTYKGKILGGRGIHLHDAIYQGAKYLRTRPDSKQRVIAVVTDNKTTPPNSRSATEALHAALEGDAVVVGLIARGRIGELVANWNKLVHGDVRGYAKETGGEVIWVKGGEELLKIPGLLDRLRVRYVLGYYPTNPPQGGKTRKIKLDLSPSAKDRYGEIKLFYRRRYYLAEDGANQS